MKLGWNIALKLEDWETLKETGEVTTKFGTVAFRQIQDQRTEEWFGYVSIQFDETQAPPRHLMQDRLDGFYDGNFDKLLEATQMIQLFQREKLVQKIIGD